MPSDLFLSDRDHSRDLQIGVAALQHHRQNCIAATRCVHSLAALLKTKTMSPFNRFVASAGLSNLADGISAVAWAWLASLLTRDALLIALVPVVLRAPWFLCALPAGVITDRVARLPLIRAMDAQRALAYLALAVALWLNGPLAPVPDSGLAHPLLYGLLLLSAAIVGVAEVFRDNAAQTLLPALVPQEGLERANGRLWSVELVGNALLGPALGAF